MAVAYVVVVLCAVAVAWLVSQLPSVRRLDHRVLGDRGIAIVAAVVAVVLVTGTVLSLAQGVWGAAVVYVPISGWVCYWTYRRFTSLRRTPR